MQTCRRLQPFLRASEQRFKSIRAVKLVASEKPRTLGPPQIHAESGNSTELLNRALESFGSEFSLRGEYRVHGEDCEAQACVPPNSKHLKYSDWLEIVI